MIRQLIIGSSMTLLSIAVHAGFIAVAVSEVRRREAWLRRPPLVPKLAGSLCVLSLWLIASMTLTVWCWAVYFWWHGAVGDFETALYFSLVSFTTLGFGDVVLGEPYRLASGLLAANGLILVGLTMAVLIDLIRSLHAIEPGNAAGE